MAIKAPPEAKLHVPHPSDGLQIYMSSESGEIEVFLCPEEETNPESGADSESDLVSISFIYSELLAKYQPFRFLDAFLYLCSRGISIEKKALQK